MATDDGAEAVEFGSLALVSQGRCEAVSDQVL
jgi:hypothetical protein